MLDMIEKLRVLGELEGLYSESDLGRLRVCRVEQLVKGGWLVRIVVIRKGASDPRSKGP